MSAVFSEGRLEKTLEGKTFGHVHRGRDHHSSARSNAPRTSFVIGDGSTLKTSVVDRTEKFEVFRIVGVPENCFFVEESDVAFLLEAEEGARVVGVRVAVGAAHAGSVGGAKFAEFVRIVA